MAVHHHAKTKKALPYSLHSLYDIGDILTLPHRLEELGGVGTVDNAVASVWQILRGFIVKMKTEFCL